MRRSKGPKMVCFRVAPPSWKINDGSTNLTLILLKYINISARIIFGLDNSMSTISQFKLFSGLNQFLDIGKS